MSKAIRGFSFFIGKTVKSVDSSCINMVTFNFTDGSQVIIDCDEQQRVGNYGGIGIIQAKLSKAPIKEKT